VVWIDTMSGHVVTGEVFVGDLSLTGIAAVAPRERLDAYTSGERAGGDPGRLLLLVWVAVSAPPRILLAPRSSLALSHTFNGRVCLYPALAALEGAVRDR
jgi:hypothetical protein